MNFDFSDDQKQIKEQAATVLAAECPPAVVRKVVDGEQSWDEALWKKVAELGWTAITIDEDHGGLGLSDLELCVIAEEMGRVVAPLPFFASTCMATGLIQALASGEQKANWLPALASGEHISTVAYAEGRGHGSFGQFECSYSDGKLTGHKDAVIHACAADSVLVFAKNADGQSCLVRAELDQTAIKQSSQQSIDPTMPLYSLDFDGAAAELVTEGDAVDSAFKRMIDRAAVLLSFEQVGGSEACLNMAKEYTSQRYAFGRQVASFQAIKHKMADMFVALELARSNAWYGAWALTSDGDELSLAAATCRVSGIDAYYECSKENIQAHGGMGFTWEFDCHLYYRRAQALSLVLGGNPWWKNQLVDRLLASDAA